MFRLFCVAILCCGCASVSVSGGQSRLEHNSQVREDSVRVAVVGKADQQTGIRGEVALVGARGDNMVPFQNGAVDLTTDRVSLDLGVRRYWGPVFLGIGGGPTFLHAETSLGEREHGWALEGYGIAGVELRLGRGWTLGADVRQTTGAHFDLGDEKALDFDSRTFSLTLGLSL
jgi:hypothetical protein